MLYPTIIDNFTTLLRAGAFGITDTPLQPMSTFKWNRLEEIAVRLGIFGYIAAGAKVLSADPAMPKSFNKEESEEVYSCADAHFNNRFKQRRYERICDSEPHDIAPSMETLHLLKLHVTISDDIIASSLPIAGIISVGRYLRNDGHKVDYIKLENWLTRLGIVQTSSLIASLLIELFGFEEDEFPYIKRFYKSPLKHYHQLLNHALSNNTNFSALSKLNIAMSESISYQFGKFSSRILNVEE